MLNKCPKCGAKLNFVGRVEIQKVHPKAFTAWSEEDDAKLVENKDLPIYELTKILGRQPGAIKMRMDLLEIHRTPVEAPVAPVEPRGVPDDLSPL